MKCFLEVIIIIAHTHTHTGKDLMKGEFILLTLYTTLFSPKKQFIYSDSTWTIWNLPFFVCSEPINRKMPLISGPILHFYTCLLLHYICTVYYVYVVFFLILSLTLRPKKKRVWLAQPDQPSLPCRLPTLDIFINFSKKKRKKKWLRSFKK